MKTSRKQLDKATRNPFSKMFHCSSSSLAEGFVLIYFRTDAEVPVNGEVHVYVPAPFVPSCHPAANTHDWKHGTKIASSNHLTLGKIHGKSMEKSTMDHPEPIHNPNVCLVLNQLIWQGTHLAGDSPGRSLVDLRCLEQRAGLGGSSAWKSV